MQNLSKNGENLALVRYIRNISNMKPIYTLIMESTPV